MSKPTKRETTIGIPKVERDRLNEFAAAHEVGQVDAVRILLDMADVLKRRGVKIKLMPAVTELEFPK